MIDQDTKQIVQNPYDVLNENYEQKNYSRNQQHDI